MMPRFELRINIVSTKNGYLIRSEFLSKESQYIARTIDETCEIIKEINQAAAEYNEDEDPAFKGEEEEEK